MQRKYIHLPREWVNPQVHCIQASLAGTGGWGSFVDRVAPVESTPVAFVLFFLCDKTLSAPGGMEAGVVGVEGHPLLHCAFGASLYNMTPF